jgi:hypothetical protein
MFSVGMVEVTRYQEVAVVTVRHRLVTATGSVLVIAPMPVTSV